MRSGPFSFRRPGITERLVMKLRTVFGQGYPTEIPRHSVICSLVRSFAFNWLIVLTASSKYVFTSYCLTTFYLCVIFSALLLDGVCMLQEHFIFFFRVEAMLLF